MRSFLLSSPPEAPLTKPEVVIHAVETFGSLLIEIYFSSAAIIGPPVSHHLHFLHFIDTMTRLMVVFIPIIYYYLADATINHHELTSMNNYMWLTNHDGE